MYTVLDHLVIGTASLADGVPWLENLFGVPLGPGGTHTRMGTHNRLLRTGKHSYIELIAIDPDAEPPASRRWFGLDDPAVAATLSVPRLLTWVVNTTDITQAARLLPLSPGRLQAMTRGDLHWLITIPDDGKLIASGAYPGLIEWPSGTHPTNRMPMSNVALTGLELCAPNADQIQAGLEGIGFYFARNAVRVSPSKGPCLKASLLTPRGEVYLESAFTTA